MKVAVSCLFRMIDFKTKTFRPNDLPIVDSEDDQSEYIFKIGTQRNAASHSYIINQFLFRRWTTKFSRNRKTAQTDKRAHTHTAMLFIVLDIGSHLAHCFVSLPHAIRKLFFPFSNEIRQKNDVQHISLTLSSPTTKIHFLSSKHRDFISFE